MQFNGSNTKYSSSFWILLPLIEPSFLAHCYDNIFLLIGFSLHSLAQLLVSHPFFP